MTKLPLWVLIIRHSISVLFAAACVTGIWFLVHWLLGSVWMASYFAAVLVLRIATDKQIWKQVHSTTKHLE